MKALLIIVPILLVGGIFGAAFMGVIDIPGITPEKAKGKAEEIYGEGVEDMYSEGVEDLTEIYDAEPFEEETLTEEDSVEVAVKPVVDPVLGAQSIAKYWDEMKMDKLVLIMENYDDVDLSLVLFYMKRENVAQILELLPPDRSALLSKEIQKLASVVKTEAS